MIVFTAAGAAREKSENMWMGMFAVGRFDVAYIWLYIYRKMCVLCAVFLRKMCKNSMDFTGKMCVFHIAIPFRFFAICFQTKNRLKPITPRPSRGAIPLFITEKLIIVNRLTATYQFF